MTITEKIRALLLEYHRESGQMVEQLTINWSVRNGGSRAEARRINFVSVTATDVTAEQ